MVVYPDFGRSKLGMESLDGMPVKILGDYDAAMKTLVRVETALADRGLKCHSGSSLGSLFASIRRLFNRSDRLNQRQWSATFLRATEAIRILNAVEAVLDDAGAKEAIHRITTSDMSLGTRQESQGKDALWELDLYRRFKLGRIPVRCTEPDLVISLGVEFGEYAIACKKIYSLDNAHYHIKEGYDQLKNHGKLGVIAFNLDDMLPEMPVLKASTAVGLKKQLDNINKKFITDNERHLVAMTGKRGACEGILVSTSVNASVSDISPPVNLIRTSTAWTNRRELDVQRRFKAFIECHDRIINFVD